MASRAKPNPPLKFQVTGQVDLERVRALFQKEDKPVFSLVATPQGRASVIPDLAKTEGRTDE